MFYFNSHTDYRVFSTRMLIIEYHLNSAEKMEQHFQSGCVEDNSLEQDLLEHAKENLSNAEQKVLSSISQTDAHLIYALHTSGFDVNCETANGDTILSKAVLSLSVNVIDALLECGANVNLYDRNGNTTLLRIAQEQCDYTDMVQYLFSEGADILQTDLDGYTSAELCCQFGNHQTLEGFLKIGYPINRTNAHGVTLLMMACYYQHIPCVEVLLKYGANTNLQRAETDETALLITVRYPGDSDMLELLLRHGADVNIPDIFQETTFFSAVDINCTAAIDLLLCDYNTDINTTDTHDVTPYLLAIANGNIECCEKLTKLKCLRSSQGAHNPVAEISDRIRKQLENSNDKIKWTEINKFFFGSGEQWPFPTSMISDKHPILHEATTSTFVSLLEPARFSIRTHLLQISRVNLISQIEQLPLPNLLKHYLYFT